MDVRSPGEFFSGSVKGAINIPLDNLQNELAKFKGKLLNVVVFCRGGNRSNMAKSILAHNGYPNVVDGGKAKCKQLVNKQLKSNTEVFIVLPN